jgi:nucleoside-diphosphate-sugar epimerase
MRKSRHYPLPATPIARSGALPRWFRRPRLLIIGAGDVGLRLAKLLAQRYGSRWRVFATTRRADQAASLRALGALPIAIDLDRRDSIERLRGLANWAIDLAPPPAIGYDDPRSRRLLAVIGGHLLTPASNALSRRLVYISTTGVYGDCGGDRFDETRPVRPGSDRARRRVDAEHRMRAAGRHGSLTVSILRVPGIYADDRLPLERLRQATPVLAADDDVYTNHIHADDLARLCLESLWRGRSNRLYHAVDDSDLKMADYFDQVADACDLPRPPRLARSELARQVSAAMLSFMSESRRLRNDRIKRELRFKFAYPAVADALAEIEDRLRNGQPDRR